MASVTRNRESCGCGTPCFCVHMCMHVCTYLFPFMCVAHSRVCRVCGEARGQPWVSFHRGHLTFFNKIFEDLFNYFMCLHVLLACMYAFLMPGTHREQTTSGSQGLALQLWDIIWVLGIDVRASARATSTLTHGVKPPNSFLTHWPGVLQYRLGWLYSEPWRSTCLCPQHWNYKELCHGFYQVVCTSLVCFLLC